MMKHGNNHIETNPDPAVFDQWPEGLYEEMLSSHDNGCVGTTLVSETDRVRVWHLHTIWFTVRHSAVLKAAPYMASCQHQHARFQPASLQKKAAAL